MSKSLPRLTLSPWELPPDCDAPPTAPVDFTLRAPWQNGMAVRSRETEYWFRIVPYPARDALFYVFCDGQHPEDGNWVLGGQVHWPFMSSSVERELIEEMFTTQSGIWREAVMRLIYFEGEPYGFPGRHRLTVSSQGQCMVGLGIGLFDSTDEESFTFARFRSPFADRAPLDNALATKQYLLGSPGTASGLLHEKNTEARFALEWMYRALPQQQQQALCFERGDISAMNTLLRAVLQSQTGVVWKANKTLLWETHPDERPRFPLTELPPPKDRLCFEDSFHSSARLSMPLRLTSWKHLIWNHFKPTFNTALMKFALCVGESLVYRHIGGFYIVAEPPTQHERLESLLLLRDWWQQNYPGQPFEAFPRRKRKSAR